MDYVINNWKMLLEAGVMALGGLTILTMGIARMTKHYEGDNKIAKALRRVYNLVSPLVNAPIKLPEPLPEPESEDGQG